MPQLENVEPQDPHAPLATITLPVLILKAPSVFLFWDDWQDNVINRWKMLIIHFW